MMHQVGRETPLPVMGAHLSKPDIQHGAPALLAKPAWSVMGPSVRSEPESVAILGAREKRLGSAHRCGIQTYDAGAID